MNKPSIKDIANHLGISKTTVSWVLSGQSVQRKISVQTRDKVLDVARKLHYEPNFFARGLSSGVSKTIGLIVPDVENPFFARMARIIETEAEKQHYNVMYCSSEENPEKESRLIRVLSAKSVDGLILAPTHKAKAEVKKLIANHFPFVLVDRNIEGLNAHFVGTDNLEGARTLVEHMISQGNRKIGVITSVSDVSSVRNRLEGYRQALLNADIRPNPKFVCDVGYNNIPEMITQGIDSLLKQRVEAIFFTANSLAIPGLKYLKKLRIKIPTTVSVGSFDDMDLMALHEPAITAVEQPVDTIAQMAVELLIRSIAAKGRETQREQYLLPAALHIRES